MTVNCSRYVVLMQDFSIQSVKSELALRESRNGVFIKNVAYFDTNQSALIFMKFPCFLSLFRAYLCTFYMLCWNTLYLGNNKERLRDQD